MYNLMKKRILYPGIMYESSLFLPLKITFSIIKDNFVFYQVLYKYVFNFPAKKCLIKIVMKYESAAKKPLIYSCSGSSSAAQMANYLAIQIDRKGIADMSCIAGVGGNVKKLVKTALSGRKIIVIDGCPLACSKACLSHHSIEPDLHIELTGYGVSKINHEDFDKSEADELLDVFQEQIEEVINLQSSCQTKCEYEKERY